MSKKNRILNRLWQPSQIYDSFNTSSYENNMAYDDYFSRMKDIVLARFEWENLPKELNGRYIENILFNNESISFFFDDIVEKYITLPFNMIGKPDIYENPTEIEAFSLSNNYHRILYKTEYEIIWSNYIRRAPIITVTNFAKRMYEIQRTIDINVINQGNPKLVKSSQQQRLTIKNFMKNVYGFVPWIEVPPTFDEESISVMDISSPYITDKLDVHKNMVWNEFLTWCGIENSNQDKKERLVADEVGSNYGNVEMSRNTSLLSRQEAAERINNKFGLDIHVSFNSNVQTLLNRSYTEMNE